MTTRKTITPAVVAANRENARKSSGPRTVEGKSRSRLNAVKHGLFLREIRVVDEDRPAFEELRIGLLAQLAPRTPLQDLAFERVVSSAWMAKLALRAQMSGLPPPNEPNGPHGSETLEGSAPSGKLAELWDSDRTDLRTRIRVLTSIRNEVAANGLLHIERWRGDALRLFGSEFVNTLTQWQPQIPETAVQLASHLLYHATAYSMPLPEEMTPPPGEKPIADPGLQRDMMAKLVELKVDSLKELLDVKQTLTGRAPGTAEFAARYAARANRVLEGAVNWFLFLLEHDL